MVKGLPNTINRPDLKLKTYFTRPYTSQDKGTVENRIGVGVLRRFFPKVTDLGNISNNRVKEVEKPINTVLFRKFNYNNPIETLKNKTVALMTSTELLIYRKIQNILKLCK